jgi:hypothetical protein
MTSHRGGQGSHVRLLWNVNILRIVDIILEKPKAFQVEEDKVLMKVIISVIYQTMSLTGKDIGGGIEYPTRPSQLKGISSRLRGGELRERKNISHLEGVGSRMLTRWLQGASSSTRGVGLTRDCTGTITFSIPG